MATETACRVCAGDLSLRIVGSDGHAPVAEAFSPSLHEPGATATCSSASSAAPSSSRCCRPAPSCTTLYRDMRDDAYLTEEAGRRATAARLLDLIAAQVPAGRLLDVGCGHGLLLDEARRRGYDTVGLELSREAARHAREALGLDVREVPLEDFDDAAGLRRRRARRRASSTSTTRSARSHAAPPCCARAACCASSRRTRRRPRRARRPALVGLPARAHVPAAAPTLRELIAARGLVISADVAVRAHVRGAALGRRARRAPRAAGRAARARSRDALPAARRSACRSATSASSSPTASPSSARPSRCCATAADRRSSRRPARLQRGAHDPGRSRRDAGRRRRPRAAGRRRQPRRRRPRSRSRTASTCSATRVNRGYGGSQKTGYVRALLDGADVIVMVHADNQYDPGLVAEMAAPILDGDADIVIGSRLLDDRAIAGGMPRWKWVGNRLLTGDREPRLRRALLRVPHGLPRVLRRLPALDPVPAQLRRLRLRPGDLRPGARARRARRRRSRSRRATSTRRRASTFATSVRYGLKTLWVLARFRSTARGLGAAAPPAGDLGRASGP